MSGDPLVRVEDLRVDFATTDRTVHAVRGVSIDVHAGETIGIVGESGSGKSVLARTMMGLSSTDPSAVVGGSIRFDGQDLVGHPPHRLRRLWGSDIAMVFQDPQASLNPVRTIGAHLRVPLRLHLGLSRRAARRRALELLELVGIPEPGRRLRQYPHELSGGMRQRVMIALAVACEPRLLIADEPTTALDVTVQRQVLDLIDRLAAELGMAVVLITHDLAVVAGRADRLAVMYAGRVVETAAVDALFGSPRHHYSRALIDSIPVPGSTDVRLRAIAGSPPDPTADDVGCAFAPRCPAADDRCRAEQPAPRLVGDGAPVLVRCHHPLDVPAREGPDVR